MPPLLPAPLPKPYAMPASPPGASPPTSILIKNSAVVRLNAPWEKVLHLAGRRQFRKGQTIDIGDGMAKGGKPCFYYILTGRVRLSYVGRAGEERTILYAGPGSLMNVPSVVADDVDNTLVICTEPTELAVFDAALLKDEGFAAAHPDLMINLVHSLAVHLVIHSRSLAEASLADSVSQVCRVVRELAERHGGSDCFAPNMTQQELAQLLGMHRTTLTRILCRLRDMHVLGKFTRRELRILDRARLDELAGTY